MLFAANPAAVRRVPRDVQLLRDAGIRTEAPALLAFLRRQVPDLTKAKRVSERIEKLGDPSFIVREQASADLRAAGREALPALRRAVTALDLERARRAKECLKALAPLEDPALTEAAARLLAESNPPGTMEVLLAYLPQAEEDGIKAAILYCLNTLIASENKADPAVVACLRDPHPIRRAAAAALLYSSPGRKHRDALRRLLADPAAEVRFEAARTLLEAGDGDGVPVLLTLLSEAPLPVAWRSEELLGRLAGNKAPHAPLLGTSESRQRSRAAWANWWRGLRSNPQRTSRFRVQPAPRAVFCMCFPSKEWTEGFIAVDEEFKECWKMTLSGIYVRDFEVLPSGRLLLFENRLTNEGQSVYRVSERDQDGTVVWAYNLDITYGGGTATRLANGNTFIAVTENEFVEVTPEGKKVWSRKDSEEEESRVCCRRLPNGNLVVLTAGGHLLLLDRSGKVLTRFRTEPPEAAKPEYNPYLIALPNGHFLVAKRTSLGFREFDQKGRKVWEYNSLFIRDSACLPSGHILSWADDNKLIELDQHQKIIRKRKAPRSLLEARSGIDHRIVR